jgi:hypothetical protein
VRYCDIKITRADGSLYTFKSCGNAFNGSSLSSLLPSGPQNPQTGLTNPAALLIELDMAQYNGADPDTNGFLRIWGLGLTDLNSASDLNGMNVTVSAGMAKGLPLANPAQAGVILQGEIRQCFGNWQGTSQTLDMILSVGGDTPGNFPFNMTAGMPLARAIANTLSIGMPNLPVSISISPNLVSSADQVGHYDTLTRFSSFVEAFSIGIIGGKDYGGVQIGSDGVTIRVFDGAGPATITSASGATSTPTVKNIAFQDLIGQPTWISVGAISFKCVLRADIHQSDIVMLPPSLVTQSNAALQRYAANPQNGLTFSGKFLIQQVHFYGNSRAPDAESWNTTYQATQA